jgi:hypothetical protein
MAEWDETDEGRDLNDAWNYFLDSAINYIPQRIQDIKSLASRPIEG